MKPLYSVGYEPELESDLADAWARSDAAGRRWLTRLTAEVDRALALRADLLGVAAENEPRVRVWTLQSERPVVVTFRVESEDRRVRVVRFQFDADESPVT